MRDNSPEPILVFSHETSIGTWTITTALSTFTMSPLTYGFLYQLSFGANWQKSFDSVYKAIRAVAEHKTGLSKWDNLAEQVSDYVRDWQLHLDKRFQMKLVAEFLHLRSDDSMRGMVDYFEHKHGYFMNRTTIKDLLTELAQTGLLEKLPSMNFAPAELKGLQRIAKAWLSEGEDDLNE